MSNALDILQAIAATIGWSLVGVFILYGGVWLYDQVDPIDYQREIRQGNVAAAVVVAAIIITLGGIIIASLVT